MAERPIQWWKRHPWTVWWASLAIVSLVLAITESIPIDPGGVPVLRWILGGLFIIFWVVNVSSLIQGLRVSWRNFTWRKLKTRPAVIASLIAIVGVLAAIAVPLYTEMSSRTRVHTAKARTDARALANAVRAYSKHMGSLPATLTDLTLEVTNSKGETAGPFMAQMPTPPARWTEYRYETQADGTFTITSSGEGWSVTAPERESR